MTKAIQVRPRFALICSILLAAGCMSSRPMANAQEQTQDPSEEFRKLAPRLKTTVPAETARARCLTQQQAKLESCGAKSGQDRVVCEAVANALIGVCQQMRADAPAYLASGLFCSGLCAIKQCPGGCPSPDGSGACLGNICVSEKQLCDPGFFPCYCETKVSGPPITNTKFCNCSCQ